MSINYAFGQAASGTWALTSNAAGVASGNVTVGTATLTGATASATPFAATGWSTYGWSTAGTRVATQYTQFTISPATSNSLTVSSVSLFTQIPSGAACRAIVYYSLDGFVSTSVQIGANPISVTTTSTQTSITGLSVAVPAGGTMTVRVYYFFSNGTTSGFPYYLKNVVISGTTVAVCTPPTTQASAVSFSNYTGTGTTVNWTRGNGTGGVIVVAYPGAALGTAPSNGTTYTANAAFGSGTLIGTGRVVYSGTGTSVAVTNLTGTTQYTFGVFEYNSASTCYLTPGASVSTYCLPTYVNAGTIDYITQVTLGTLSQATASNSPVYKNYQSTQNAIPNLTLSTSYSLSLTFANDATQYNGVWVDWDHNGVYAASEFFTSNSNAGFGTAIVTITVPAGAVPGITPMRIRGGEDSQPTSGQACGASASGWGQAQDYVVNVVSACTTPTAYAITGGGSYCAGGSGVPIGLANTQNGSNFSYQLKNGATNVGSPVTGTGAAISFGNQTAAGTYTVVATNTTTSCPATMTGSATVTIAANNLTASAAATNQAICNNGSGAITLTRSGGSGSYGYAWSNGASTQNISGVPSGAYTVTVSDLTCPGFAPATASATITAPWTAGATAGTTGCTTQLTATPGILSSTLFTDDFESYTSGRISSTSTPWKEAFISGFGYTYWKTVTAAQCAITGTRSMSLYNYNYGFNCDYDDEDYLQIIAYNVNTINATGYTNLKLNFKWTGYCEPTFDYMNVCYSQDGGANWNVFPQEFSGANTTQTANNFDLSSLNGQSFLLGFLWTNDAATYGSAIVVDDISITGDKTPTYSWTGPAGANYISSNTVQSPYVDQAGTYTVAVTNSGCTSTASVAVSVSPGSVAPTGISGTTSVCSGGSTTLTTTGGSFGSGATDIWYTGSAANIYDQTWNTQPFGAPSTTVNSVNGILNVTSTTNDPMIDMTGLGSFNPSVYKNIQIRYRVTAGTAGVVEVFFYNAAHAGAVGGESASAGLISDGAWHVVNIDMTQDPDYAANGNITGWRFDWASNSGVTMDIDFIALGDGVIIADGTSITVSPTTTTTYYTNKKGSCNNTSATSQAVTVTSPGAPGVTSPQSFCGSATVASLSTTGGTAVQWYAASSGGSALAGTTSLSSTTYYASQTIGCESATRTPVSVTVTNPSAPAVSTTQSFCNSGTVSGLSTTGGTNVQWYAASSGGSPLAGTIALSSTTYYASQTISGCESSTRTAVAVTLTTPAAPAVSTTQSFCNSGTVSSLSTTGGTSVQWYAASSGGSPLAGTTALSSTTYYASQTISGCESATRTAVAVTLTSPAAPAVSTTQSFCNSGTVASLSTTGGTNVQWYTASSGGSALAGTTALSSSTYYASQTISGCESATRTAVAVTLTTPAAPAVSTTQSFCNSGTVSGLSTTGGTNVQWYIASSGGSPLAGTTALSSTTYYASQTITGCESSTRTAVAVTLTTPAAPAVSTTQSFCNSGTVASLSTTGGTAVQWYAASSGGSPLAGTTALSSTTYYASQTISGCESSTRTAVAVTLTSPAAPAVSTTQSFCNSGTVASLSTTGGTNVQWYAASSGGSALAGTTALSSTTYYASQTISGCESSTRTAVAVTLTTPAAPAVSTTQSFCNSGTVASLSTTGGTAVQWYAASSGGSALAGTTALSSTTYYASQTISGCESSTRTAVAVTLTTPAAPAVSTTQSFCALASPTVSNLSTTGGTSVLWYSASSAGPALSGSTGLSTGTYYASQTISGCESSTRTAVAVTVNPIPNPMYTTVPSSPQCAGNTVTYTTQSGNIGYIWSGLGTAGTDYTIISGGISSTDNTVTLQWLTSGTKTVRVTYTANGCAAITNATNTIVVNVRPVPTVAFSGAGCTGSTVTYTTQSGHSAYIWTISGTATTDYAVISGGSSNDNTLVIQYLTGGSKTVTVNYSAGSCPGLTAASDTRTVTTGPTSAALSDAVDGCNGGHQATVTIAGGTSPYSYTVCGTPYTGQAAVVSRSAGANASCTLTLVTDANGCPPLSVTGTPYTYPARALTTGYTYACTVATGATKVFYDNTGNLMVKITDGGNTLGNTTVVASVDSSVQKFGPNNKQSYLQRHFKISPTNANGSASVCLYISDAEVAALNAASAGDNHGAPSYYSIFDTVLTNTVVTKYHGAGETPLSNLSRQVLTPGGKTHNPTVNGTQYNGVWEVCMSVTSWSGFYIHGQNANNTPLPVTFLYLTADAIDNKYIQLDWATASEIHNNRFEVQRSTDGVAFETIGTVAGHGTSNEMHTYQFEDKSAQPATVYYYKLKQVDDDGQFLYTEIVSASLIGDKGFTFEDLIPNPANDIVQLGILTTSGQKTNVTITDVLGREVLNQPWQLAEGYNISKFDISPLAGGTYTVTVYAGNQYYSKKLVVTR